MKLKSADQSTRVLRDVQYGLSDGVPLLMNIVLPDPASDKPVPVVVFFHGGGWSGGTREDMMSRCDMVSKLGYVAASVEYRLSGVAPFPAQLQDCKCAVRYLRANAAKYGIDPNRIAVWGCSAGGHLAAMMGLTEGIPEFDGDGGNPGVPSNVQLVIDCFGPTDFISWQDQVNKFAQDKEARRLFAPPADEMMVQWWTNFSLEKDPGIVKMFEGKARERAAWASPVTYADQKQSIKAISEAEKWQDQNEYRRKIKQSGSRWSLLNIGNPDNWIKSEQSTTGLTLSSEVGGVTGKCLAYEVQNVGGWGVFVGKIPDGIFKPTHNAISLWAKGDANTPEVFLELDEKDGSRWMYNLKITPEWTYYEIPFTSFSWLAGPSERRIKSTERFNGRSADKISFGLANLNNVLKEGAHHIWVDGLGSTQSRLPQFPEFLIVQGSQDTWVPAQQSMTLADMLDKNGTDVTILLKANMGHDESKAFPEILEYLKKSMPIIPASKKK
ncbi:MAG: alpha/beta hydrolase fold domain-containing protein [Armatimonadota bacterium]